MSQLTPGLLASSTSAASSSSGRSPERKASRRQHTVSSIFGSERTGVGFKLVLVGIILMVCGFFAADSRQDDNGRILLPVILGAGFCLILIVATGLAKRLVPAEFLCNQLARLSTVAPESAYGELSKLDARFPRDLTSQGWNTLLKIARDRLVDTALDRREGQSGRNPLHDHVVRSLRSLPEGLAISDKHGNLIYWNPAWNTLCGKQASATGNSMPLAESLGIDQFTKGSEILAGLLRGSAPLTVSLQRGTDTSDGILQLTRSPLDGRLHDSEGFVWLLRDITQQTMAGQSHEQFLSAATHELRTPITNIRAYAESLSTMDDISREEQNHFFNVITDEAQRLGRLLDELLNLQQLQAGSMTLNPAMFDILRMLNEVQSRMTPLAADKGLKLVSRIAPNLKPLAADKEKLTAALVNLLGNAIKYTSEGEVRLVADQIPGWLVISIEDTGIGIAAENIPRLFERFYRCPDERVQQTEGNGLGLAFAREVIGMHNGQLTVESELNKGSRFTVRIPLASDA